MDKMKLALILNVAAVICFAAALLTQNLYLTGLGGIALLGAALLRIKVKKDGTK